MGRLFTAGQGQVGPSRGISVVRVLVVFLLISTAAVSAEKEPAEYEVRFRCAPDALSFSVGDLLDAPEAERGEEILFPEVPRLDQTGQWGSQLRAESQQAVTRECGVFKLVFQSRFLNRDPDGELGVIELGTVQVLRGSQVVLPRTAFGACHVQIARYKFLGSCPAQYARRIVGRKDEKGNLSFAVVHEFWGNDAKLHSEQSLFMVP